MGHRTHGTQHCRWREEAKFAPGQLPCSQETARVLPKERKWTYPKMAFPQAGWLFQRPVATSSEPAVQRAPSHSCVFASCCRAACIKKMKKCSKEFISKRFGRSSAEMMVLLLFRWDSASLPGLRTALSPTARKSA